MVDIWVEALLREREGYQRDPRKSHKVIGVDDELAARGFGVDSDGKLVELAKVEKATAKPSAFPAAPPRAPRERAVSKAPETAVPKD